MSFYKFGRAVVRFITWFGFKVTVTQKEEIPMNKGFIIACNHVSNFDPIFLGTSVKPEISYMAKEELFKNKFIGFILRHLNAFKVSRGTGDTSAIDGAIQIVKENRVLGIFPEGTRSKDGQLRRAKSGVIVVASASNGDVLPAAIKYGERKFIRRQVYVSIGNFIKNEDLKISNNDRAEIKKASALIMDNIAHLLEEMPK